MRQALLRREHTPARTGATLPKAGQARPKVPASPRIDADLEDALLAGLDGEPEDSLPDEGVPAPADSFEGGHATGDEEPFAPALTPPEEEHGRAGRVPADEARSEGEGGEEAPLSAENKLWNAVLAFHDGGEPPADAPRPSSPGPVLPEGQPAEPSDYDEIPSMAAGADDFPEPDTPASPFVDPEPSETVEPPERAEESEDEPADEPPAPEAWASREGEALMAELASHPVWTQPPPRPAPPAAWERGPTLTGTDETARDDDLEGALLAELESHSPSPHRPEGSPPFEPEEDRGEDRAAPDFGPSATAGAVGPGGEAGISEPGFTAAGEATLDDEAAAAPVASPVEAATFVPAEPAPTSASGEPAALAFATDPATESSLREGLSDLDDLEVWPGRIESAIAVLANGHTTPLLFVDLDETPYPAGAIHELAAVCEVGTTVIALGSDGTARFSREILLAGVSDYLVKPVSAAAVREAAARAAGTHGADPAVGWSVGFMGTGGSGATTLAAATALLAAARGRYVSVLDLDRTFPALAFLLDVEPAAGLVDLLSTTARASLHPEMVDAMRATRSERIAVYGYPWSETPPHLAPIWAVNELLVELRQRSHLVIVDGLDDPATHTALLATLDERVLVVEPTADGAAAAARCLERLGPLFDTEAGWPSLLVRNHTRAFRKKAAGQSALDPAGLAVAPDVTIPFEPSLPWVTDRGWPRDRLPASLRKPLATLADRIFASAATNETAGVPSGSSGDVG